MDSSLTPKSVLPTTPDKHIAFPAPAKIAPTSPSFSPRSPTVSPISTEGFNSPAVRPSYPKWRRSEPSLKTYADALKQPRSGVDESVKTGRFESGDCSLPKGSGLKLFLNPSYAKKTIELKDGNDEMDASAARVSVKSGSIRDVNPLEAVNDTSSDRKKRSGFATAGTTNVSNEAFINTSEKNYAVAKAACRQSLWSRSASSRSSGSTTHSRIRLKINLRAHAEHISVLNRQHTVSGDKYSSTSRKRTASKYAADDESDTDSDMYFGPSLPHKHAQPSSTSKTIASKAKTQHKKQKIDHTADNASDTDSDMYFGPILPRKHTLPSHASQAAAPKQRAQKKQQRIERQISDSSDDTEMSGTENIDRSTSSANVAPPGRRLILMQPALKRLDRIVDANCPADAALIAASTKTGPEVYDSDAADKPGNVTGTKKPHLFRNVRWGPSATDYNNSDFPREPEFTQFVPGRWEHRPDGTLQDQKAKLIIKLTDKRGNKRIFTNPPPCDWQNQDAISALNKRTVQQIRRNTTVRFREVVTAYTKDERRWILAHLQAGKPTLGWKRFVNEFNQVFAGKIPAGSSNARPTRTHSSLTKEVERFRAQYYSKGLLPVLGTDE